MERKVFWFLCVIIFESIACIGLSLFWYFYVVVEEARNYYTTEITLYTFVSAAVITLSYLTIKGRKSAQAWLKWTLGLVLLLLVYHFYASSNMHLNSSWESTLLGVLLTFFIWLPPILGFFWLRLNEM